MQTSFPLPIKLVDRRAKPRSVTSNSTIWRALIWAALILVIACSSHDNAADLHQTKMGVQSASANSEITGARNGSRPYRLP